MPFVKLDCAMLDSTVYIDRDVRDVFITALLMAVPREVEKPIEGLNVVDLGHSGFVVPPGFYGMVEASGPGIARRAGLKQGAGMKALEALCNPETESRSRDFEGRRMVRVDGGYIVLNYGKYRERDYGAAERMRVLRARRKRDAVTANGDGVHPNTARTVTHADADADAVAEKSKRGRDASASSSPKNGSAKTPKGTRIPEGWQPVMVDLSVPGDFDLKTEAAKFRDYWRARAGAGGVKLDWDATWRNWVRRAISDGSFSRQGAGKNFR